jgi:hypothetical protein
LAKECTEYIDTQLAKYLTVDSSEKKTTWKRFLGINWGHDNTV